MYCGMIDCYFNKFFVKSQLKKENLKSVFWATEFGCPNRYTGLPNGLNTSMDIQDYFEHIIKKHETVPDNPPISKNVC